MLCSPCTRITRPGRHADRSAAGIPSAGLSPSGVVASWMTVRYRDRSPLARTRSSALVASSSKPWSWNPRVQSLDRGGRVRFFRSSTRIFFLAIAPILSRHGDDRNRRTPDGEGTVLVQDPGEKHTGPSPGNLEGDGPVGQWTACGASRTSRAEPVDLPAVWSRSGPPGAIHRARVVVLWYIRRLDIRRRPDNRRGFPDDRFGGLYLLAGVAIPLQCLDEFDPGHGPRQAVGLRGPLPIADDQPPAGHFELAREGPSGSGVRVHVQAHVLVRQELIHRGVEPAVADELSPAILAAAHEHRHRLADIRHPLLRARVVVEPGW